jgi:hypothetical protein
MAWVPLRRISYRDIVSRRGPELLASGDAPMETMSRPGAERFVSGGWRFITGFAQVPRMRMTDTIRKGTGEILIFLEIIEASS